MHNHVFRFPEDKRENYNPDGMTLTGVCRCGATQEAYGMRWMIPKYDSFLAEAPFGEVSIIFDSPKIIC